MKLSDLIEGPGPISDVSAYLGNLTAPQRWGELCSLSKRCQRTLYLKAEASEPLSLQDFVPAGAPDTTEVVHAGRNSLPMFRDFEKRFARTEGRVYGYNEGSLRGLIGPGYFVIRPTIGAEQARGAVVVDYFEVPQGPVPVGWPDIRPNWKGLQYFVYHKTRDYLRGVAPGITIGSAWKTLLGRERALNSYFILMQRGGPAPTDKH